MRRFDQGSVCAAPEMVTASDTRCSAPGRGGVIRATRCGAVAGSGLHAPMT